MNKSVICLLGILLVTCSSVSFSQKTNDNYDTCIISATEFLLKEGIVTNRCITQNDTIFITVKDKGEFFAYYFDKTFSFIQKPYLSNEFKSRSNCLLL